MNQLDQLKEEIEALMSENEVVKSNAVVIQTDMAVQMYANARRENRAYQNVLELIEKINKS